MGLQGSTLRRPARPLEGLHSWNELVKSSALVFQRNRANDHRAATASALDFKCPADETGSIVHNPQTHSCGAAVQVGERQSSILNSELKRIGFGEQADGNTFGFAVFDGV